MAARAGRSAVKAGSGADSQGRWGAASGRWRLMGVGKGRRRQEGVPREGPCSLTAPGSRG